MDALTLYSRLFGPYPYQELDVVETPARAGGIEYPTLVVISDRLYTGHPRLEWVVAHEVAHQWWYGMVGSDQVDEPWLDEALTQYTTLLYHEFLYGPDTAAGILKDDFQANYDRLVKEGNDMPAGLPVAAYPRDLYSPVVYRKGRSIFTPCGAGGGRELLRPSAGILPPSPLRDCHSGLFSGNGESGDGERAPRPLRALDSGGLAVKNVPGTFAAA